ncbi:type 1 glutamine amidotransferase [Sciscionella marina]|uniref:type 1 glutamine amidotransferase n=1 Tax=Sciscionella marina TaxID=508770 RepID=UPI000399DACC|nr:type 1 glutamine amidotransferase [Sciscionella marina]
MTPLLIVQPDATDPAGPLADWLTEAGAELTVCRPFAEDQVPADLEGFSGLVVLGGAMGALDDEQYPWLAKVRALLSSAVANRVPTLAICLGAQLLAVATGGRVREMPEGAESGPSLVAKRDAANQDPLWAELPFTPDVIQFHRDEITALPGSAQLLAAAPRCTNQAFRVGQSGYATQFHIETTPRIVLDWAAEAPEGAAAARAGTLDPEYLATVHEYLTETWRPFAARFVRLAAGELEPASSRISIPLV